VRGRFLHAAVPQELEVRRGSLTRDLDMFLANVDPSVGSVRVGVGRTHGPIMQSGSVLEMVFRVRDDARAGLAAIILRQGIDGTITALNEGGLVLNPDPTDRAGDVLDGLVRVAHPPHRRRGADAPPMADLVDAILGAVEQTKAKRARTP
jgi:hypothetical protein